MGIRNVDELREHLQWAMSVELSLIPPYLYAMYSIVDSDSDAYKLIRSVVTEEMLHAVLDANLMVGVGGHPEFYRADHVPTYPMSMPHHTPPLTLHLEPVGRELLEKFILIEKPKEIDTDALDEDVDEYETQGQFYMTIEHAIERLHKEGGLFDNPQLDRQMARKDYYTPVEFDAEDSGGLVLIDGIEAAREAIDVVIHQGEGLHEEHWADPGELELTHYFKFKNIADGDPPLGDVWPMVTNPKRNDLNPALHALIDLFNAAYSGCLVSLDEIYRPQNEDARGVCVKRLYRLMRDVMGPVARHLATQRARPRFEEHAGPTFEFFRFESTGTATAELAQLATDVCRGVDELQGVAEAAQRL